MKKVIEKERKNIIEIDKIDLDKGILLASKPGSNYIYFLKRTGPKKSEWIWRSNSGYGATGKHDTLEGAIKSVWDTGFVVTYITGKELLQ